MSLYTACRVTPAARAIAGTGTLAVRADVSAARSHASVDSTWSDARPEWGKGCPLACKATRAGSIPASCTYAQATA